MGDYMLVLLIVLSAYFLRGITGFGSGLIAVPLLALSYPLQFVVPLVLALDFTASFILGGANKKQASWSETRMLLPFKQVYTFGGPFALLNFPHGPVLVTL